jgi:RNA polymerase sigma-B factor
MPERSESTSGSGGDCASDVPRPPGTATTDADPDRSPSSRGSPGSTDELLIDNERLAERCARRYIGRGEPYDDLVQVAWIGLIKAVERFDPRRGTEFASFAMPTILGELRRHFRDLSWKVSVPRGSKDRCDEVRATGALLEQALGRPPRRDEVARRLHIDPDTVTDAVRADHAYRVVSLDAMRSRHGDVEPFVRSALIDESASAAARRIDAERAISELDERSRTIIYWRFYDECTQAEIGERLGLCQAQVSRLLRSALEQLRERLDPPDPSAPSSTAAQPRVLPDASARGSPGLGG